MNALHCESLLHAFGIEWWKKYDKERKNKEQMRVMERNAPPHQTLY